MSRHRIGRKIGRGINKNFVDRIYVHVLRRDKTQVNIIDTGAELYIMRHTRFGDNEVKFKRQIFRQLGTRYRTSAEAMAVCICKTASVGVGYTSAYLEHPRPASGAEPFQRRRHCKTDCFVGTPGIGYDKIGIKRIKTTLDTFHRGIKRFQIDGNITTLPHVHKSYRLTW